jgi:hypothetical protein
LLGLWEEAEDALGSPVVVPEADSRLAPAFFVAVAGEEVKNDFFN